MGNTSRPEMRRSAFVAWSHPHTWNTVEEWTKKNNISDPSVVRDTRTEAPTKSVAALNAAAVVDALEEEEEELVDPAENEEKKEPELDEEEVKKELEEQIKSCPS